MLGSSPPAEAIEVARTVIGLGFDMNTSLVRDEDGTLLPVSEETRAAYETIRGMGKRAPFFLDDDYTKPLMDNGESEWKCRAGARTFHVDEFGLVHLCAPRVGSPGKPIAQYTVEDIRYWFNAPKPCASKCPVAYARHASRLDGWRSQNGDLHAAAGAGAAARTASLEPRGLSRRVTSVSSPTRGGGCLISRRSMRAAHVRGQPIAQAGRNREHAAITLPTACPRTRSAPDARSRGR